ncbi:PREDICTED: synaptojanin-2-binding protein isoform X1 [Cercocebus atys]|uniref:synaptojanin-2-binding protein isoform X1 n=1 Tax=Cercocebus atys TaxID=9531 RepID=UPI0005F465B4|nr:PREDICTED: synaptojanin-2-binding protein isoform X1 [Cercocebus atys]
MNGRVVYLVAEEEINLTRGPSGLGFNIVGGTDQQYVSNDSGIYVSRIKENGAAALDGRLQEGDKILSVNGQDLKNLLHQDAVDLFRNAGYAVSLRVQHRVGITSSQKPGTRLSHCTLNKPNVCNLQCCFLFVRFTLISLKSFSGKGRDPLVLLLIIEGHSGQAQWLTSVIPTL